MQASQEVVAMNEERADAMIKLLSEVRDLQRETLDRQNRFLWMTVPIFAVLCVQAVLLIVMR